MTDSSASRHNELFIKYVNAGRTNEARTQLLSAISLRKLLVEHNPGIVTYVRELARNYVNLGMFQRDQGQRAESVETLTKAILLLEDVLEKSPNDQNALQTVAAARKALATVQTNTGD